MWKAERGEGGAEERWGSVFDVGGLPPHPAELLRWTPH